MFLQFNLKRGGQRVATMLMYLSDDVEGGETHFPLVSASLFLSIFRTHTTTNTLPAEKPRYLILLFNLNFLCFIFAKVTKSHNFSAC